MHKLNGSPLSIICILYIIHLKYNIIYYIAIYTVYSYQNLCALYTSMWYRMLTFKIAQKAAFLYLYRDNDTTHLKSTVPLYWVNTHTIGL